MRNVCRGAQMTADTLVQLKEVVRSVSLCSGLAM